MCFEGSKISQRVYCGNLRRLDKKMCMGEFLGRSLFIPIFFVVTGFLINPITLVYGIFRQLLARCLHHRCPARRQVHSRLAHNTLGAAGQRLLDDRMFNVVLLLVFATSVLGPFD